VEQTNSLERIGGEKEIEKKKGKGRKTTNVLLWWAVFFWGEKRTGRRDVGDASLRGR